MKKFKVSREEQRIHENYKYDLKFRNTIARNPQRQTHAAIIKQFFPTANTIICVGARHDSEVISFIGSGFEVLGIDFADRANQSSYIDQIDAHDLDHFFDENEFDIAYCSHSLEHMHTAEVVLSNIRKVTSMGMFAVLPALSEQGKSHCSVFDIMGECERDINCELNHAEVLKKRPDLWKDFEIVEPFNLSFFERFFWEPPTFDDNNDIVKVGRPGEFAFILEWE